MGALMKAPEIQWLIGSESPEFLLHSVYETAEQSAWWHKSLKTRIPQGHSVRQPLTNVLTNAFG